MGPTRRAVVPGLGGYPRPVILLLASASPARLATLRSAGIEPRVRVSGVDEDAVLAAAAERFGPLAPADEVLLLAQAKAEAASELHELDRYDEDGDELGDAAAQDVLVLGCDSLLELDGRTFGKPVDAADATARWRRMRGRTGILHTGHWLIDLRDTGTPDATGTGGTLGITSSTTVHFADLSDAEIAAYVATGEPLAVAGAFTVDGLGGPFVTGIEGDHHGVVGLSLPVLRDLLGEVGVIVPDLWARATKALTGGPATGAAPATGPADTAP
ncbi:nucleoside triphosphate pyrophosphatase [Cellulomonas sp. KRMCY2]|uniref:Maf family protein n=1 Tax=Cellulomonas sp. KRMCY2 TaxID=1304865 RepID=UPI0004B0A2F3|nr:nucleoside triphosphate pyrophosphatase [Cellulomonas sp. KRMCY2]